MSCFVNRTTTNISGLKMLVMNAPISFLKKPKFLGFQLVHPAKFGWEARRSVPLTALQLNTSIYSTKECVYTLLNEKQWIFNLLKTKYRTIKDGFSLDETTQQ